MLGKRRHNGHAVRTHSNGSLRLAVKTDGDRLTIRFLGRSTLRNATDFVLPILLDAMTEAQGAGRRIVMDFRDLAFMNSSTLSPVIKVLEKAHSGDGRITVTYRTSLRWQDISFSALSIFQTGDGRIEVTGTA